MMEILCRCPKCGTIVNLGSPNQYSPSHLMTFIADVVHEHICKKN